MTDRALNRAIGRRLGAARSARGLTLARLSELTGHGISVSRLSHYELGQRRLSIEAAWTLATALGDVSAAHLLGLEADGAPRVDPDAARLLAAFRATDTEGRRRVLEVALTGTGCGSPGSDSN